jgi:hypothetical protein
MECSSEILINYRITSVVPNVIVDPFVLLPTGTHNGKSYYTWSDAIVGLDFIIVWDIANLRWDIGIGNLLSYTPIGEYTEDVDCPATNTWDIFIKDFIDKVETQLGAEITPEEVVCYNILVWNKQCEFAQCVYKYLQAIQFGGSPSCEQLDNLKNKRRALEILNCYDTRDIVDNTTNYNFLTYSQIKKLLNY